MERFEHADRHILAEETHHGPADGLAREAQDALDDGRGEPADEFDHAEGVVVRRPKDSP